MLDSFYVDNKDKFLNWEKEINVLSKEEGSLIVIMQKAQDLFGYLPIEVQVFIGEKVNVPLPDIYGVATFYSQFNLEKQGDNSIGVCQGTACYVKGSRKIQDEIEKELSITAGETTEDNVYTLNETRWLVHVDLPLSLWLMMMLMGVYLLRM